jgi:hypothetical protein
MRLLVRCLVEDRQRTAYSAGGMVEAAEGNRLGRLDHRMAGTAVGHMRRPGHRCLAGWPEVACMPMARLGCDAPVRGRTRTARAFTARRLRPTALTHSPAVPVIGPGSITHGLRRTLDLSRLAPPHHRRGPLR